MTIEIGRLVVKTAGRDAGRKGIIIDILDDNYVLIDGETRRRKCNVLHIEPLAQIVKIEKNASHEEIAKALKEISIEARQTKPKPKSEKPRKKRKTSEQLKAQKEEKRKLRDLFRPRKKEEKTGQKKGEIKEETLEDKAGIASQRGLTNDSEKTEEKAERSKKAKVVEGDFKITQ